MLIGLSLLALLWLIPNHTGESTSDLEVAPGFFPQVAAGALLVLSVLLVGHRLIRFPKLRSTRPETGGVAVLSEIAILAAGGLLVAWALGAAGYLVVAPAVMLAGLLAGGERRWWVIALVIAGVTAATWFGADRLFGVVLP
ncbi:MAG: tripartite tricarboxylate transporter TctB family protein [Rhodospirillaceae bacterium]|nr:tripartite tricarboxylate transporter TctB family protein [Rhodospirillaceae bacterium]